MLDKSNYLRKLTFSACLLLGLSGLANTASAQFIGISADVAIAYSAAPGSASGYSVGISHPAPFFPNIGYSNVSFKDKETIIDSSDTTSSVSLDTTTTIKTAKHRYTEKIQGDIMEKENDTCLRCACRPHCDKTCSNCENCDVCDCNSCL